MPWPAHAARLAVEDLVSRGKFDLQLQLLEVLDRCRRAGTGIPRHLGREFRLEKGSSRVHGHGIFLASGQISGPGRLVCLYPGTVYLPGDPLWLASVRNRFILQRLDGLRVDGRDSYLSAVVYRSAGSRSCGDFGYPSHPVCDTSWLRGQCGGDHLNCGHYVNFVTEVQEDVQKVGSPNVSYIECDLSHEEVPLPLRRFLPSVFYNMDRSVTGFDAKLVALVSLRPIVAGEELFSLYHSESMMSPSPPP